MIFIHVLNYRLDAVGFLLLGVGGWWLSHRILKARSHGVARHPGRMVVAVIALLSLGVSLAEWAGNEQRRHLVAIFSGFGPTYAAELAREGHARIQFDTPADDPVYLTLIEREKEWLRLNPLIADIYTFRRDAAGRIRFIVDSETDYNHDGRYESEREQRTPIGEVFEESTSYFDDALAGKTVFDGVLTPDRWGVWVSSLCPIYAPDGRVEAALGIDYPADAWLRAIALRRGLVLSTALVVVAILLSSATLVTLMRSEIRQRREAQQELQRAKEAADAANRAKGEFVAVISHEIRTPLSAVTGYASLLQDTPLDPEQQRFLHILQQGANNVIQLVNNLLDFAKIEEGKLQLEEMPCSPHEVIAEVLDLMAAKANEKHLALRFEDQLEPQLAVLTDPVRLRQIVTNLVSNAVKFTGQGSVTIRARWQPDPAATTRGTLEIAVIDTGPGIPPEKIKHLFQMFTQLDASTARRHGGTGLGLAICRRLAELMHGQIGAQSVVGRGSEFTFRLPCARSRDHLAEPVVPAVLPSPALPPLASAPPPRPVLIVDDNAINRQVLQELLQRAGYACESANSGRTAVELAGRSRYAAILMDVEMPEMDGITATKTIRRDEPPGRHTPILAVTAFSQRSLVDSCRAAGMDGFVPKPIDREVLLAMLAQTLGTQRPA
jgi:signal transduction histidine kinase/CheY-like chemotaxis protein